MRRFLIGSTLGLLSFLVLLSLFGHFVDATRFYGSQNFILAPDLDEAVRMHRDEWIRDLRPAILGQIDTDPSISSVALAQKLRVRATVARSKELNSGIQVTFFAESNAEDLVTNKFLWRPSDSDVDVEIARDGRTVYARLPQTTVAKIREQALLTDVSVLNRRCGALELHPCAMRTSSEEIAIKLPLTPKNRRRLSVYKELLLTRGRIEFKVVDDEADLLTDILKATNSNALPTGLTSYSETLPNGQLPTSQTSVLEFYGNENEPASAAQERWRRWLDGLPLPQEHVVALGVANKAEGDPRDKTPIGRSYYLIDVVELSSTYIAGAMAQQNPSDKEDPVGVLVKLSPIGTDRFKRLTEYNIGKRFAILLEGRVESAPVIQSEVRDGFVRISMGKKPPLAQQSEAKRLATLLDAGELVAPLRLLREEQENPNSVAVGMTLVLVGGFSISSICCLSALAIIFTRRVRNRRPPN